ncbi:hypothetical protein [Natronoglycomyces albus]|uniref:ATP-grasp domain-containing protein n=1 Tax=Natronoglycomyces albus TaxID=2811108 RepID=A0A895XT46_9ACTN|nr:hypothetical protein [Natronoglycomyces albus]QSB04808.1 hypothetical protein JQS30_13700 [Natronoglycomyces albus]
MTAAARPTPGSTAEELRIDRVSLIQYSGLSIHARVLNPPLGFLLGIKGTRGGEEFEAWGEAAVPGRVTAQTWRALHETAAELEGSTISLGTWAKQPRQHARFSPWWTKHRFSNRNAYRFANLLIESLALEVLDQTGILASQGWAVDVDEVAAQRRHLIKLPTKPTEAHRQRLHGLLGPTDEESDETRAPIYRVECTGNVDADLALLAHMADTDTLPAQRPTLWLTFTNPLATATAEAYVDKLSALQVSTPLTGRVIVEDVLPGRRPAQLVRLQKRADAALSHSEATLSIAARRDINSAAALKKLLRSGHIDVIVLDPNEWGSFTALRDAATSTKEASANVQVWLNGSGFGCVLTRRREAQLFASTAQLDGYCLDDTADKWSTFQPGWDPEKAIAPRVGPQQRIDLLQLAPKIDKYLSLPAAGPSKQPQANDFSSDFMPGLPTGMAKQWHLEMSAMQAGLSTRRLGRHLFLIEQAGREPVGFTESQPSTTSMASRAIAREKGITRALLDHHDLPIAPGFLHPAGDPDGAEKRALEMGFPLVVKPEGGSQGMGITTGINNVEQLRRAFEAVENSRYAGADLIIERHVTGADYRIIATPDEALAVIRRDNARVWGDGRRTIEELILEANTLRRRNPNLCRRLIDPDQHLFDTLEKQGYTIDEIPAADVEVELSTLANLSQGGTSTEVFEETHPTILDLAVRATRSLGLPFAGVDLLIPDHRVSVHDQSLTITEMNHNAAVLLRYPMYGPPRDVCEALVRQAGKRAGMDMTPRQETLNITVTITGHLADTGYGTWFAKAARALALNGSVREAGDTVSAHLHGEAMRVTGMLCLAHKGSKRSLPVEIHTQPTPSAPPRGFTIDR